MTDNLEQVADTIRAHFERTTAAREKALSQARALIRSCSLAIRAVHRLDKETMQQHLDEAERLASTLREKLAEYPALYYAGYTQDAIKEYVEARATCALILGQPLPGLDTLQVEPATYLRGLAETVGELRRRILDILRHGYSDEAEHLLMHMDEIYAILVTMDYPDAITYGLRRLTDIARSIIERTRGDITFSLRSQHLSEMMQSLREEMSDCQSDAG